MRRARRRTLTADMRGSTLALLCALSVARALPTALPGDAVQKKLTEVANEVLSQQQPIDNTHSEQELVEQVNSVTDIDNSLRINKVEAIPVKVVTEDAKPTVKDFGIEKGSNDDVPKEESAVKRQEVDLSNPGEPQRQEHDSQSPQDATLEQQAVAAFKQGIADTQAALSSGLAGVRAKIHGYVTAGESGASVEQSIAQLRDSFNKQIEDLNETLLGYLVAAQPSEQEAPAPAAAPSSEGVKSIDDIEEEPAQSKGLLFNRGSVRQEATAVAPAPAPAPGNTDAPSTGSGPWASVVEAYQNMVTNVQQNMANFQTSWQNFVSQNGGGNNTAAGPGSIIQSVGSGGQTLIGEQNIVVPGVNDETATQSTNLWANLQQSVSGFFRPGQSAGAPQTAQADTPAASGPFAGIQNLPIYQNVVGFFNRPPASNTQAQPAAPVVAPAATDSAAASNETPASEVKPEAAQKQKPSTVAPGPLQQIVQRLPLVSGVAQRLQTMSNPEKPRDAERGHLHLGGHGGHGGSGDNNNGDSGRLEPAISEPAKEVKPIEEPQKEVPAMMVEDKKEESTVAAKTE
ncbi:hypothetical protein JYU34_013329 [Plutella xylostella]|uniref:Uncharacterized protein n=1 Tax=Plutella xylostella TaxID=51655 RepID=A0ABQ7Q9Y1_PLUXY|nr:hypothetical protein JYU34_013329 [Plutella xylostella]